MPSSNQKQQRLTSKPAPGQLQLLITKIKLPADTLLIGAIIVITFLIYAKALNNELLIGWDDGEYMTATEVQSQGPIDTRGIFSNFYLGMYQPLAVFSFAVTQCFAGDQPSPYILTNLILHLLNTLLVYKLMRKWMAAALPALIVSFLFALHPIHVEGVAWISTRSTLLSSMFFLMAMLSWEKFLTHENTGKNYLITLLFALLALLSKSMAMTLVLVLALQMLRQNKTPNLRNLLQLIPFLMLSVLFGIISIRAAESFGHITALQHDYSIFQRLILNMYAIGFYLLKAIVPTGLSAVYAFPDIQDGRFETSVYLTGLIPVILAAALFLTRKHRHVFLTGYAFFLVTISVVLPLIWSRTFIAADRYTYLSYIGIFIIFARIITDTYNLIRPDIQTRKMLFLAAGLIGLQLTAATYVRIGKWKNTPDLLTDVIEQKRSDADMAHGYFYLANYFDAAGNTEEAAQYYKLAISRNTNYLLAYNNPGIIYGKHGNFKQAVQQFNEALHLKPDYAEAYYNRGVAEYQQGDFEKACNDWHKAWQLGFKPASEAIRSYCLSKEEPDFGKIALP